MEHMTLDVNVTQLEVSVEHCSVLALRKGLKQITFNPYEFVSQCRSIILSRYSTTCLRKELLNIF
jgi:hypothetical protein